MKQVGEALYWYDGPQCIEAINEHGRLYLCIAQSEDEFPGMTWPMVGVSATFEEMQGIKNNTLDLRPFFDRATQYEVFDFYDDIIANTVNTVAGPVPDKYKPGAGLGLWHREGDTYES